MRRGAKFSAVKRGRLLALALLLGLQSLVAIWQAPIVGATTGSVIINEIQPGTGSVQKFIELYNHGTEPVDISGWKFARGTSNLSPVIPAGTTPLAPGQFYGYTTTYSLPLDGGSNALRLLNKVGEQQDAKIYAVTKEGNSVARVPDGSDTWQEGAPTIGHTNAVPVLAAPQQGTPADTAVLSNKSTQFSWSPVADAQSYRLQLARTNDFANPLVDRSGLTAEPLTLELTDEGSYFWRVAAVAQNAESTWSVTRQFAIDTLAPTITISPSATAPLHGTKTITASVDDANPGTVTLITSAACGVVQPGQSLPASVSLTLITPAGVYANNCQVTAVAIDAAGNRSEQTYTYTLDNQAPSLNLGSPEIITNDTVFAGTFSDQSGIASYSVALQDSIGTMLGEPRLVENSGEISFRLRDFGVASLPNGSYQLVLQASDTLGNQTAPIVRPLTLENTLGSMNPVITASSPNASNSTFISLSGQTLGSVAIMTVRILDATDGTVIATLQPVDGRWSYQIAAPTSGTYRYVVEAIDENGNVIVYPPLTQVIARFLAPIANTIDGSLMAPLSSTSAFRTVATPTTLPVALQGASTMTDRPGPVTAVTPVVDATPPSEGGVVVAPTPEGWKVFGIAWYWWLLFAGLVGAGGYYLYRRRMAPAQPDHTLK